MLRVSIKNQDDIETNAAEFETEEQILAWIELNHEFFPVNYTHTIISLVDIQLDKLRLQESEEALLLGENLIKQIRSINRRKLKLGIWTQEKFNQLLASVTAAQIERALWNGSFQTAAYLLTSMSNFYSDIEIGIFLQQIQTHETKWVTLI